MTDPTTAPFTALSVKNSKPALVASGATADSSWYGRHTGREGTPNYTDSRDSMSKRKRISLKDRHVPYVEAKWFDCSGFVQTMLDLLVVPSEEIPDDDAPRFPCIPAPASREVQTPSDAVPPPDGHPLPESTGFEHKPRQSKAGGLAIELVPAEEPTDSETAQSVQQARFVVTPSAGNVASAPEQNRERSNRSDSTDD